MDKKQEEVKTVVWVFWIIMSIIGVSLLFAGIQGITSGEDIVTVIMLIVIGIILLFVGLTMIIGKANIATNNVEMPKAEKKAKK